MALRNNSARPVRLEDEFYRIMTIVSNQDWLVFARRSLRLPEHQIDDICADHPRDNREQKYQMLSLWQRRNGRTATPERLHQLAHDFNEVHEQQQASREVPRNQPAQVAGDISHSAGMSQYSQVSTDYNQAPRDSAPPRPRNFHQNYSDNPTVGVDENESIQTSMRLRRAEVEDYNYSKPLSETIPKEVKEEKVQSRTATTYPNKAFHAPTPDHQNITRNLVTSSNCLEEAAETSGKLNDYCSKAVMIDIHTSTSRFYESHFGEVEDIYKITHNPKGAVWIMNNSFRGKNNERHGSQCDLDNMERLWQQIGCKTIIRKDLPAHDSITRLKKFASSATAHNSDFVVVVIMSHGGRKENGEVVFYGDDGDCVEVREVLETFNNANARRLQGIPKLFFFQICRGTDVDKGVVPGAPQNSHELQDSFGSLQDTIRNSIHSNTDDGTDALGDRSDRIPTISDCLISYATQAGFKAFRNNSDGSWFINAIVNIFLEHAHDQHVADLMTKVNKEMSKKSARSKRKENLDGAKVMSDFTSTLLKKLYLFPGFPDDEDDGDGY